MLRHRVAAALLDPAPGPARDLLRRELSGSEYRPTLLERARDAVLDLVDRATNLVAETGAFNLVTLLLLSGAVALGLLLLLARLRPETRAGRAAPVLGATRLGAAEHRARAREALAGRRWDDAVVEAVRGLARDLEQRPRTGSSSAAGEVRPGSTAREVVGVATALFGDRAGELERAARGFEDVVYGGTHASADDARRAVELVEELAGTQPGTASDGVVAAAPR